jgi:uncharacterized protein (DUF58 family)
MAAETSHETREILAIRRADGESRTLAASLPRLVLEARRIAANVIHGLHGRRRAGAGESFWQYRRFVSGEPSQNVDWRRSARDDHLYVREQEWEAAHTVWLWPDRSASMAFASKGARDSKLERGLIVTFALAELLVSGGERVGIPGLMNPTASRNVIDKMAQAMLHDDATRASLPPSFVPSALAEIVVLSDLWSPMSEIRTMLAGLSASGAHGSLIQVVDPAEETFPYAGRVEFVEPEGFGEIWRSATRAVPAGISVMSRAVSDNGTSATPRRSLSALAINSSAALTRVSQLAAALQPSSSRITSGALLPPTPVCGFQIGPAAARITIAAAASRSRVSHHGVRDGVSSLGLMSNKSRVGGNSIRRGRGGITRNSHHSTGRLNRPSSSSGCAKVRGSPAIMRCAPP